MTFCYKCGELIPENELKCPKCGTLVELNNNSTVIYASQDRNKFNRESGNDNIKSSKKIKNYLEIWIMLAAGSLIFMGFDYLNIKSSLTSESYTGYNLMGMLQGIVGLSGLMVIVLAVADIAGIVMSIMQMKNRSIKMSTLRMLMRMETIISAIAAIIPYFQLSDYAAKKSVEYFNITVGYGCYLNILVVIVSVIIYLTSFEPYFKEQI